MQWAVISHPQQVARTAHGYRLLQTPMVIAEHCVPAARDQGWIVLGLDSDLEPTAEVPAQSNPRRKIDELDVTDRGDA